MRLLIRGLVYAENEDEALATARNTIYDRLIEEDVYASYDTPAEGSGIGSGLERMYHYPAVVRAHTDEGRELVREGWTNTVDHYESALERVEEFLDNHTYSDLWEDRDVYVDYSHQFRTIGQTHGSATFLYDQHGRGIRDKGHLLNILTGGDGRYGMRDNHSTDLYVVPAEVKY